MPEFKIAEGFIEVDADINQTKITAKATLAGAVAGAAFGQSFDRTAKATSDGVADTFYQRLTRPSPQVLRLLRTGVADSMGSPLGLAAVGLGAMFASSFIGAVITSGMFGLVSAGFTGVAIAALKDNERLAAAWERTGKRIGNILERAADPMVPAFDDALGTVRDMFSDRLEDPLHDIFAGIAPSIEPLAESLTETLGRILDDLATPEFLEGFREVTDEMASELPRLGDSIGGMLLNLAENSDEVAEGFNNVITVTGGLIGFVGDLSLALTDLFNKFSDLGNIGGAGLDLMVEPLDKITGETKDAGDALGFFFETAKGIFGIDLASDLIDWLSGADEKADGAGKSAHRMGKEVLTTTEIMREDAVAAAEALEAQLEALEEQADAANERIQELRESLFGTADAALAVDEANDALLDSIDAAKEAADDKNKVSREERAALRDVAQASHDVIEAMIDQGKSAEEVRDKTETARRKFIEVATQMGYTADEADDLADRYGLIPEDVETLVELIGAEKAKAKAAQVAAAIARIKSKIVTISINEVHTRIYRNDPRGRGYATEFAHGGIVGSAQAGGPRGNRVLVGEHRPEVVDLPIGSRVIPSVDQAMDRNQASGGGSGGPVVIELHSGGTRLDDLLLEILRGSIRVKGGDVQVVLGSR